MVSTEYVRKWRTNNPERQKQHEHKQHEKIKNLSGDAKEKYNEYMKNYRNLHREKINAQMRESYRSGPRRERYLRSKDRLSQTMKIINQLKKQAIIGYYSNGSFECACCGFADDIDFYSIDHINNGGNEHHRREKFTSLYDWLIRNNLPEGFQVLCHNCNMGKKINGNVCPHKSNKENINSD